jgi:hypothetical protein
VEIDVLRIDKLEVKGDLQIPVLDADKSRVDSFLRSERKGRNRSKYSNSIKG